MQPMHMMKKDCGNADLIVELFRALVQYCFMNIIRTELEEVKCAWNVHRIRQQNTGDVIPGIPDLLYHVPEMLGQFIF